MSVHAVINQDIIGLQLTKSVWIARRCELLLQQKSHIVTAAQQKYIDVDSSNTLANVFFLIIQGYQQ
jgi:hypothetical protein